MVFSEFERKITFTKISALKQWLLHKVLPFSLQEGQQLTREEIKPAGDC